MFRAIGVLRTFHNALHVMIGISSDVRIRIVVDVTVVLARELCGVVVEREVHEENDV